MMLLWCIFAHFNSVINYFHWSIRQFPTKYPIITSIRINWGAQRDLVKQTKEKMSKTRCLSIRKHVALHDSKRNIFTCEHAKEKFSSARSSRYSLVWFELRCYLTRVKQQFYVFFYKAEFAIAENNKEYIDDHMWLSFFSRDMLQISR